MDIAGASSCGSSEQQIVQGYGWVIDLDLEKLRIELTTTN